MFDLLFEVVEFLSQDFQIIITDNADLLDDKFKAAIVERWRGLALIPEEWI